MVNIGLTGGIGSGKSTVARLFQERGAYIIDIDVIAHLVEKPGGVVWKRIVDYFGTKILDKDNTIDREKLGGIVFRNSEKLKKLNSIVHPAVFDEWQRRLDDIGSKDKEAIVISDIPLLIEVMWHRAVDMVILVYTSPDVQAERIMERNGYSYEESKARFRSQMPMDEKIPFADFVINNEGTREETEAIVDRVWKELLKKGSSPDQL
ncbi:MAG: dephospho-CoA kinase [Thermodesulfobacteriota bacterium]|nr:dephospho-CoA kinase [Thermodesulfobacteriota bacterium]